MLEFFLQVIVRKSPKRTNPATFDKFLSCESIPAGITGGDEICHTAWLIKRLYIDTFIERLSKLDHFFKANANNGRFGVVAVPGDKNDKYLFSNKQINSSFLQKELLALLKANSITVIEIPPFKLWNFNPIYRWLSPPMYWKNHLLTFSSLIFLFYWGK